MVAGEEIRWDGVEVVDTGFSDISIYDSVSASTSDLLGSSNIDGPGDPPLGAFAGLEKFLQTGQMPILPDPPKLPPLEGKTIKLTPATGVKRKVTLPKYSSVVKLPKIPGPSPVKVSMPPKPVPPPLSPAEIVRATETPLFFNGDVGALINSMWVKSTGDPVSTCNNDAAAVDRALLYASLNAVEPARPTLDNSRVPSAWADREMAATREGPPVKDSVSTTANTKVERGGSPGQQARVVSSTTTRVDRSMSAKAGVVAARIKNDGPRVAGLMETAPRNRQWVLAVLRSIAHSGIGPATKNAWTETFSRVKGMTQLTAKAAASQLEKTIDIWLRGGETSASQDGKSSVPEDLTDSRVSEQIDEQREAFIIATGSIGLVPAFVSERVCPHCVYFELKAVKNKPVNTKTGGFDYYSAKDRVLSDVGGTGWLQATALMHNKEMHALNGNIDRPDDVQSTRGALFVHLKECFWDAPTIATHREMSDEVKLVDAENSLLRSYYSDSTHSGNTYWANAGTIHQWVGNSESVLSVLSSTIADRLNPPVEPKIQVAPETSTTPEKGLRRPHPEMDEYTRRISMMKKNAECITKMHSEFKWVGVSHNPGFNHGCLVETDFGIKAIDAASRPDSTTPGIINPQRGSQTSGYVTGAPVLGYIAKSGSAERVDWRDMGIRVALYEDLRHGEFVQPTGVEWAWPRRTMSTKHVVSLPSLGLMNFEAVFISGQALTASMKENNGYLLIGHPGNQVKWSLTDDSTRVISLQDAGVVGGVGMEIWILSHLAYPMAWVFDSYSIAEGEAAATDELFLRSACLVDLPNRVTKLVFIVPTQDRDIVKLGDTEFKIARTDRHGNPDLANPPVIHHINNELDVIIDRCLSSNMSLREAYTEYAAHSFEGGLNWLEIDSLITALTVRWHPRVEAYYGEGGEKRYRGAPSNIIKNMYNGTADSDGQSALRLHGYGGWVATTSLDVVVAPLQKARARPHITIGKWSNMAELTVGTGVCLYKTYDKEEPREVGSRLRSGLHDRLMRARFLRKVVECWKRDAGYRDEIAFPGQHTKIRGYWSGMILPKIKTKMGMKGLAEHFITKTVRFGWDVNFDYSPQGATFTGIRLPSGCWRTRTSTEWGGFSICHNGRTVGAGYDMDNRAESWTYNRWIQTSIAGAPDVSLEGALNRLNLEARDWNFVYKTHPSDRQVKGVSWLVDTNKTGQLAELAGWTNQAGVMTDRLQWGWGIATLVRNWPISELTTLTITRNVGVIIEAGTYSEGTWLSRGAVESYAGPGLVRDFIGAEYGWETNEVIQRQEYSEPKEENMTVLEVSPDVPAQITLESLLRKVEEMQSAMDAQKRMLRNYQDHNGPDDRNDQVNFGTRSSGQHAVHPLAEAAIAGKGSSSVTERVLQRPEREEEIASATIAKEGEKRGIREVGQTN